MELNGWNTFCSPPCPERYCYTDIFSFSLHYSHTSSPFQPQSKHTPVRYFSEDVMVILKTEPLNVICQNWYKCLSSTNREVNRFKNILMLTTVKAFIWCLLYNFSTVAMTTRKQSDGWLLHHCRTANLKIGNGKISTICQHFPIPDRLMWCCLLQGAHFRSVAVVMLCDLSHKLAQLLRFVAADYSHPPSRRGAGPLQCTECLHHVPILSRHQPLD